MQKKQRLQEGYCHADLVCKRIQKTNTTPTDPWTHDARVDCDHEVNDDVLKELVPVVGFLHSQHDEPALRKHQTGWGGQGVSGDAHRSSHLHRPEYSYRLAPYGELSHTWSLVLYLPLADVLLSAAPLHHVQTSEHCEHPIDETPLP